MRNNYLILKFSFQQVEYSQIFEKMINFSFTKKFPGEKYFLKFSASLKIYIIFAEPGHELLRCIKMVRHNNNLGFLWGVIEEA
jgi:hypothetical protein